MIHKAYPNLAKGNSICQREKKKNHGNLKKYNLP